MIIDRTFYREPSTTFKTIILGDDATERCWCGTMAVFSFFSGVNANTYLSIFTISSSYVDREYLDEMLRKKKERNIAGRIYYFVLLSGIFAAFL